MADRQSLQVALETLLGSQNVYYQPPGNLRMKYPAIRYSLLPPIVVRANNQNYHVNNRYEVILIGYVPDSAAYASLIAFPYSTHERRYTADNLYHDVFTIYY